MKIANKLIICAIIGLNSFSAFSQVVADFSSDVTQGCAPSLKVTFTNKSTGPGTLTYLWEFGNGNTSTETNPQASYNSAGNFLVKLTVSNGGTPVSKSMLIKVFSPPIADFSASQKGCIPFSSQFTDLSVKGDGDIVQWNWDFSNGQTSNVKNPLIVFTDQNVYSPILIVTDNNGCTGSNRKNNYIDVANKPSVSFTTSPSSICKIPATVNFTNGSTGKGTLTYEWNFGNGSTGTQRNPVAIYDSYGTYNVSLKVNSSYGCSNTITVPAVNVTKIDAIGELTQESKVLATTDYACASAIVFNNKSVGTESSYWDFGDGNVSFDKITSHTYTKAGTFTVRLIASPGNSCADTAKWTLTIEKPSANFNYTPTAACYEPILVNYANLSTGAASYLWTFHDNSTATTQNTSFTYTMSPDKDPYVIHATKNFPVTLKVTSTHGCVDNITKNFSITKPTALFSTDVVEGCVPLSVNFSENSVSKEEPITLRKWIYGDGTDATTTQTISQHTYNTPGVYNAKLVVSTVNCRDTSYNITIKVGQIPAPDFQITSPTSFYSSQPVTINDMTPAGFNIDYWSYSINGENITNCTDVKNVSYLYQTDIGALPVTLTVGSNGCYRSKTVNTITALGPISTFSYNIDCASPLVYNFTGVPKGATSYEWDFGDGTALVTTSLTPSHTYSTPNNYTVKLTTYNNGYSHTSSQTIYVRQPNAQLTADAEVCANLPLKLNGKNSHPIFSTCRDKYVWDFGDGTPKIVSGTDSLNHIFKKRGTYNVVLKALYENGCSSSVTKAIRVYQPYALLKADTTKGCNGLEVNFTDNSTPDVHALTSITWNYGDLSAEENSAPGATKQHPYTLPAGEYSYSFPASIRVKDNFGCENTSEKSIGISQPFASFSSLGLTSLCASDSLRLISTFPSPDSAIWNMGDGKTIRSLKNPFAYKYTNAGSYGVSLKIYKYNCVAFTEMQPGYVTVQKANAQFSTTSNVYDCPMGIPFVHDGVMSPVDSGRWDFGDSRTGTYIKNASHTYDVNGNYRVKLRVHTSFGCMDTFSRVITINGPSGNFTIDRVRACKGEAVTFTMKDTAHVRDFEWDMAEGVFVKGNPVTYKFKTTGEKTVALRLYASKQDCYASVNKPFSVDTLNAIISVPDTVVCEKEPVYFTNNSIGDTGYSWDFGNSQSSGELNPIVQFGSGTFKVALRVVNINNCKDTAYKTMIVHPIPLLTVSNDTAICIGQNVLLKSQSNGDSLAWSPNQWISDIHIPNPLVTPELSTRYKIRSYYKATGCYAEDSVMLGVQQRINFRLTPHRDTSIIIGETVQLLIQPDEPYDYLWQPSTYISCPTCESNDILPLDSITYTLVVTDKNKCFMVDTTFKIMVKDTALFSAPDAFMPNGNDENRILYVKGKGIKQLLEFKIYNRWGNLVFQSNDLSVGWDGKFKGKDQPIDTYIYTITIETMSGNRLTKKGSVLLIR